MRAFEIHTFQGGKWKIDSVFDDRELAVFEAQRMEGSKRYSGVRVVEENFDEQTHQTQTRTIYKGTVVDNQTLPEPIRKQAPGAKGPKSAARGGAAAGRRGTKGTVAPKAQKSNGLLIALLSIIVIGGISAMVALRFLSGHL